MLILGLAFFTESVGPTVDDEAVEVARRFAVSNQASITGLGSPLSLTEEVCRESGYGAWAVIVFGASGPLGNRKVGVAIEREDEDWRGWLMHFDLVKNVSCHQVWLLAWRRQILVAW